MRALIIGSSGMVGSEVLAACITNPAITRITTVDREKSTVRSTKVTAVALADFADFTSIKKRIAHHDIAFYCVGVYQGSVSEEVFATVTVDYLAALARAIESPHTTFCLLSAGGAQPRSTILFARWKGRAEEALKKFRFKRTYIFRPGYIHPSNPARRPKLFRYTIFYFLYPIIDFLAPRLSIRSRELAEAMVSIGSTGSPRTVFENNDIRSVRTRT